MNRIIPHLIFALIALVFTTLATAALYQIAGTKDFVNGIPSSLTTKERSKLVEMKAQTQTESACIGFNCVLLDKEKAKAKIKSIIATENVVIVTPPPVVVQPVSLMPFVDVTKNMTPLIGASVERIQATTVQPGVGSNFRIVCEPSHMSNDDPLVFPNQQNATHHHIFYGNTSINYKSDLANLPNVGNSTCAGGTANRSAYWTPTLINTDTNAPVMPDFSIFYYKKNVSTPIVSPPKGLRMLSGNSKATIEDEAQGRFTCYNPNVWYGWTKKINSCKAGEILFMTIEFPSCWDGKNLDSPNHKDHMTHPVADLCPASHPVAIPVITFTLEYKITADNQNAKWRLASDNYAYDGTNAGFSMHGDWVNGWNQEVLDGIVKNCINAGKDAHAHLLCDGRTLY